MRKSVLDEYLLVLFIPFVWYAKQTPGTFIVNPIYLYQDLGSDHNIFTVLKVNKNGDVLLTTIYINCHGIKCNTKLIPFYKTFFLNLVHWWLNLKRELHIWRNIQKSIYSTLRIRQFLSIKGVSMSLKLFLGPWF